jgi:hypothetical protein
MTGLSDLDKLHNLDELEQTLRTLDRTSSAAGGAEDAADLERYSALSEQLSSLSEGGRLTGDEGEAINRLMADASVAAGDGEEAFSAEDAATLRNAAWKTVFKNRGLDATSLSNLTPDKIEKLKQFDDLKGLDTASFDKLTDYKFFSETTNALATHFVPKPSVEKFTEMLGQMEDLEEAETLGQRLRKIKDGMGATNKLTPDKIEEYIRFKKIVAGKPPKSLGADTGGKLKSLRDITNSLGSGSETGLKEDDIKEINDFIESKDVKDLEDLNREIKNVKLKPPKGRKFEPSDIRKFLNKIRPGKGASAGMDEIEADNKIKNLVNKGKLTEDEAKDWDTRRMSDWEGKWRIRPKYILGGGAVVLGLGGGALAIDTIMDELASKDCNTSMTKTCPPTMSDKEIIADALKSSPICKCTETDAFTKGRSCANWIDNYKDKPADITKDSDGNGQIDYQSFGSKYKNWPHQCNETEHYKCWDNPPPSSAPSEDSYAAAGKVNQIPDSLSKRWPTGMAKILDGVSDCGGCIKALSDGDSDASNIFAEGSCETQRITQKVQNSVTDFFETICGYGIWGALLGAGVFVGLRVVMLVKKMSWGVSDVPFDFIMSSIIWYSVRYAYLLGISETDNINKCRINLVKLEDQETKFIIDDFFKAYLIVGGIISFICIAILVNRRNPEHVVQGGGSLDIKNQKSKGKSKEKFNIKLNKYNKWLIIILLLFAMIITHYYKKNRNNIENQQYLQQMKDKQNLQHLQHLQQMKENRSSKEIKQAQPISVFGGQYL